MVSELRVPTVAMSTEVLCADGRSFRGRVFVPALASHHTGPMRLEEWLNEPLQFFPFLPDDADAPVLMNKREVLVMTFAAPPPDDDNPEPESPHRRVAIECEARRLEGVLVIDMPSHLSRVLDCLNRAQMFLTLLDGDLHHLIQKERITRVLEIREE
jgi:hypothetical protein